MRLTRRIFDDLAIFMVSLGVIIGLVFPFFSVLLGVPREIAITFNYFMSCIFAGIILGLLNIILARKTVGARIKQLSQKMRYIESILTDKKSGIDKKICTPETCLINIESDDEFGESADSFNNMVRTLSEVLETQLEIQIFSEMLTSHLELNILASETLVHLIKNTNASGGAILIEKDGEMIAQAVNAIKNIEALEKNSQILLSTNNLERQLTTFPDELLTESMVADSSSKELLIEPIVYKHVLLGVLLLVKTGKFSINDLNKISFYNQIISLAFRNAITHNQMQYLAAVDSLTGLYNRRFGIIRMEEEFSRSIRLTTPFTLLMFDLDRFKNINDTYGHLVGDEVLKWVAKLALSTKREADVFFRYGGEEFMCILPGVNQKDAFIIAERIRTMIMDSSIKNNEQDIKVTISIGLVTYPFECVTNIQQLIQMTDKAMYEAKNTGRNRTIAY